MVDMLTCCFTGHRELPGVDREEIKSRLSGEILAMYKRGVRRFIAGGAIGFDTYAEEKVLELSEGLKGIELWVAIPFAEYDRSWTVELREKNRVILGRAAHVETVSVRFWRGCYSARNRWMVENSEFCIACYDGRSPGGTAYTVRYARAKGLNIVNICDTL